MEKTLTLTLDEQLLEAAKKYAAEKQQDLSALIENYLKNMVAVDEIEFKISPEIRAVETGKSLPADLDYKKEYYAYQAEKHK
jgi:hypothetical protein